MKQEFSPYFVIYMDLSLGFVTWICLNLNWLLAVTGVMHEADDAYSIRSTWSCYWLDQFLTLALNILILSIFYISMDLSNNYFAHFSGCWASFACSCHYPRMLCHVFWSQVEYKIVCFIYDGKNISDSIAFLMRASMICLIFPSASQLALIG